MEKKTTSTHDYENRSGSGIAAPRRHCQAENAHQHIDSAIEISSQFYYCQKCQDLIKLLTKKTPIQEWRVNFELDVMKIVSGGKCCLCALILGVSSQWFKDQPYEASNQPKILEVSGVVARPWFCLKYGGFLEFIQIENTPESSFKYSSYQHFVTESTDSNECWSLAKNGSTTADLGIIA